MPINVIDKLVPKNDAFVGVVDEDQILRAAVIEVTGATYTVLTTDQQIDLNRAGVIAVTIDDDNKIDGRRFFIGDVADNAATYNHTITPETGTIMGETSAALAADGEQWEIYWSAAATDWRIR